MQNISEKNVKNDNLEKKIQKNLETMSRVQLFKTITIFRTSLSKSRFRQVKIANQ